jgi:hypothetical protein
MPPRWSEPVFFGLTGSETSYWMNSPVPQHETYRKRSSSDRLMNLVDAATHASKHAAGHELLASCRSPPGVDPIVALRVIS